MSPEPCQPCSGRRHWECLGLADGCACRQCCRAQIRGEAGARIRQAQARGATVMGPVLLDSLLKVLSIDSQRNLDWRRYTSKTAAKGKPSLCQAPECGNHVNQNAYGRTRLYCSAICRWRATARRDRERTEAVPEQPPPEPEPAEPGDWSPQDYGWSPVNGWPSREVFDRFMKGLAPRNRTLTVAEAPPGSG